MENRYATTVLSLGEILFDIFETGKRLGGAPFNFSYHLKQFGFNVLFASRLGEDENGRQIRDFLKTNDFDDSLVQSDPENDTGHVLVRLDQKGVPDFDIVPDVSYDYLEYDESLKEAVAYGPALIYYGTLIQRTEKGFDAINRILSDKKPETRCFYDINLRRNCYNEQIVRNSLEHADVLKLNEEEMAYLEDTFGLKGKPGERVLQLMNDFSLEWVSITRGSSGSELFIGKDHYTANIQMMEPQEGDTVGAGDAYAAVLARGYLEQWSPEAILEKATEFAADICKINGAIPEDNGLYKKYS